MTTARLCHHETCFLLVNSEAFMSLHTLLLLFGITATYQIPFACFLSFFFLRFSYYNCEVWLKAVGVEPDQLCLGLLTKTQQ